MSKANRDNLLQRGEQLLKEWDVATDADAAAAVGGLRAAMGRDPAADVAIASRLGALADPASVEALLRLENESADKRLHKEVRRALYRLEQRGLAIPAAPAVPPLAVVHAPSLEGYLSPVDGPGDQLVWIVRPRPAAVAHLYAVTNDPEGLREVDLFETTRKALRTTRQELQARHQIRMIETDWRYCDFLIDRALHWATERGNAVSGDYRGWRAQLTKEPVRDMAPPIRSRLDVDAVRAAAPLLADSAAVLEEPELRTWLFDQAVLQPYLDEIQQVKESPLLLSEVQQQERIRGVVERAVEELFGAEAPGHIPQGSWVRRLEEMAYHFHATGRVESAKRALAAALALETSTRGGRDIPLCETLARASLLSYLRAEEQQAEEESRGQLVVTPQQALREAQRRR